MASKSFSVPNFLSKMVFLICSIGSRCLYSSTSSLVRYFCGSLIKCTLSHGPIAHIANAEVARFIIFFCEANAGTERNLCAHNSMASEKSMLFVEDVHRAAFAFAHACFFGKKFGHYFIRAGAKR